MSSLLSPRERALARGESLMSQRSFLTNFARENLQTLNLRRFFGDYRTFAFDPEYFHLGIGEIANITDDVTWQRIIQDFDSDPRLVSRATMYSGTRGEYAANQAMAEHVGSLLGRPELGEQHVVPYDGGHNAVNGVIRAGVAPLGSPRDERQYVLLPTPCYPYFSTILNAHCGVIAYTAYTAEEMVRGIETLINPQVGVVLLNTPHNPTGYALTPAQVARINRAVAPYDCVLAMDMVYALNTLDPQAMRTLGGLDPERTIYIDSFSKKFGLPGFRLGFAICTNAELIEALRMIKADEFGTLCHERYKLEVVPGTRMYPPAGLAQGTIALVDGSARISSPGPVVYAPDFAATQRPFVRVSFGIEHRVPEAAARLRQACAEIFTT